MLIEACNLQKFYCRVHQVKKSWFIESQKINVK